jgi:DnaK suppressor protein
LFRLGVQEEIAANIRKEFAVVFSSNPPNPGTSPQLHQWKEGMTDAQRQTLKAKIIDEIAKARQDVSGLEEITRPADTEDMDEISRMDSIVTKSVNDAALVTARSRLAGLEYALKRIDDPEFGFCIDCGEEIPLPRLMAMPQATHCVGCAG